MKSTPAIRSPRNRVKLHRQPKDIASFKYFLGIETDVFEEADIDSIIAHEEERIDRVFLDQAPPVNNLQTGFWGKLENRYQ